MEPSGNAGKCSAELSAELHQRRCSPALVRVRATLMFQREESRNARTRQRRDHRVRPQHLGLWRQQWACRPHAQPGAGPRTCANADTSADTDTDTDTDADTDSDTIAHSNAPSDWNGDDQRG